MTVVARTTRDTLTVTGPDAVGWLQGQLSQDVAGLAPGEARWSFLLSPQGKVDGWGRVHRLGDDALRIDVDRGAGAAWLARLERFKLRTRADLELATDVATVSVRGSESASESASEPASESGAGLAAGWPGLSGVDHLDAGDAVLDALVADGAMEVDADAFEALRIRAGVPRWGAELTTDTIPATLGQWIVDSSVSFTKGCYTGQELVARIDSRGGHVPRRLAVLTATTSAPEPGAEVVVDGNAAGTVTSSAPDAHSGGSVALVFVPRAVELPAPAEVAGSPAHLSALPLPVLT